MLYQRTILLPIMWWLYIYSDVMISGVGHALLRNILPQNNQLLRWKWLEICRVYIVPGFLLRGNIRKVTGFWIGHHGIFVLTVGFHTPPELLVKICIHCEIFLEVVFVHRFWWNHRYLYHDVFLSNHLVFQVKIFYVHAHVSSFYVWDGTVKMEFHGG